MWCTCDRVVVEAQDPPTLAIHIASSDDRARTFLVLALSRHRSLAWCDCAVSIKLRITFTAEYPAAVPEIELADAEGISGAQESQLRQQLEDMAQELVGSAMVFTLASHITEWINEYINNAEAAAAAAEAAAAEAAQAAKAAGPTEEERLAALVGFWRPHTVSGESERLEDHLTMSALVALQRANGTPVTVESFKAWKAAFDAEMAVNKVAVVKNKKPTGTSSCGGVAVAA